MRWRNCEACDGTGESEQWDEAQGVYHDHPCTTCGGQGQVLDDWEPEHGLQRNDTEGAMDEGSEFNCPSCDAHMGPGDRTCRDCGAPNDRYVREGANEFDKFMDSTLLKEGRRLVDGGEDSAQRRIARGYQERPLGKIRMGTGR